MFRLINIISCTTSLLAVLWSVNVNAQSSIIGPNSVVAPGTYEYTVNDGVVYTNAYWEVNNNATVVSTYVNGLTYGASIYFNGTGSFVISFMNETTLLGTTNVAASCGGDFTPNATFTYASSCGSSIITVGGAPPFGQNWYWQTDPLGISQATDYSTPFSVTAAGIYYLRPALSSGCWGTALATAPVTIDPLPTVLASNQSICSNQSTSIDLSNPNGGPTTFSWIVSAPGVTGASAGSGSTIAQQLSIGGNSMATVTYTVTATVNGCSGNPSVVYVVVKPRPTASAPNQTLCSQQSTSIAITNPNNIAGTTYTWTAAPTGVMGSNGGSGSTIAQSLSSTTGGTVTYSITPSANGCVGAPINVVAIVNPLPSAPSVSARNRFDAGPFTITATGAPAGGTYNWYSPSNSLLQGNSATYVTPTVSANTSNYAYAKTVSGAGCLSSGNAWASLNMEAAPIISAPSNRVALAFAVNLDAGPGYVTYDWRNSSNATVGNTRTFSTNATGNYTVRVTKTNVDGTGVSPVFTVQPQLGGLNENYIVTNTIQVNNITDPAQIPNLPVESNSQTIQYFDGLGRPMQTVGTQASPTKKDVVQSMIYDAFGRENKKYLPVITNTVDGWYKTGLIDTSGNYVNNATFTNPYSNGLADKIADDSRPFSETVFEPSPLNRPSKDFGTGLEWYTNNRAVQHAYLVNVNGTAAGQEQVIVWKVDAVSGLPIRETAVNTSVSGGYYTTGQLSIKSTKDEQGNEVREYTDKEGRVILKKVQAVTTPVLNTAAHWAATYYIYDDLGNLRYVLQPELSKTLLGSFTVNPTQQQLDNLAFQYKYDARRRMSEKKVPGAGWVFMVYDLRDRLVLTQDANQRAGATNAIKYWTFTKYDELNRPILTGIKDTTTTVQLTQAQMQAAVDAHFAKASARWGETYVGNVANNLHGYTNRAYPVITSGTNTRDPDRYLTVTYYDNYNFKSLWVGNYNYLNETLSEVANGITYTQPTTESSMTLGLTTGSKTKVLDGGVAGGFTWLEAVTYYDDKGRPVQTVSDNYKGGIDRTTTVPDFVGKALETKTTHNESDVTWKDQVGVSLIGNRLTRTATTTAGAASTQVLGAGQNGWLEVIVSETNTNRYIGFNDTNPDVNATNIDYAFYLNSATLIIIENNVTRLTQTGVLKPGDVLRIERTGSTINYYRNGAILPYTRTGALTTALMVDASLQTNNATLIGVRTSFSTTTRTVTRRMQYDHAGWLMRAYHLIGSNPTDEVLLTQNEYNEVGQLVDKMLHSKDNGSTFKQSVDYRYNIRGWLRSMNNSQLTANSDNDDTNDFFGMELGYNNSLGSGNAALYNGNISGMKWSRNQALGTVKDVAYNYSYDPLNRILSASYLNNTAGTWANASGAFSESGYAYDQNGNITALTRKGATGANMDLLAYNYGTMGNVAYANQLLRVGDTGDKTTGFVDGANTGNDYTYDANGNMITDQNKGITGAIAYNFLNLPELVTRGTSNTLRYIYDATGRKLAQVATYNSAQKQTEYMGEYQYENDVLLHLNHEEGRIVVSSTENQYTNSGDNNANITATNAALALVTQNGTQTYIRATSSGTVARTGITFTTLNVTAGERYVVRVKGYRDKGTSATSNPVFLSIKANGVDQGWPGATLANTVATEAWTEQSVVVPAGATTLAIGMGWNTTVTAGEVFFVNDVEVTKIAATAPEYQYNLKDHLGNVRVTFTSKDETENSIATSELSNSAAEQAKFLNREKVRAINSALFDHTYDGQPTPPTGTYAQRLSGKDGEKIGLARSISVMPGDKINIEVYAKYYDPTASNEATFANLMSAIINNIGVPAGTFVDGSGYGQSTNLPFTPGWAAKDGTGAPPMAYLNWMVFDRNYSQDLGRSGYMRITTNAKETGTNATHDKLFSPEITITQPGYVYIWLSNENPTPVEVYFDDLKVTQMKSPVVESQNFYPFGALSQSYSRENSLENNRLYQGKEYQKDLSLNLYDFEWRQYDPWSVRTTTMDPHAEMFYPLSPYSWAGNNPLLFVDPDGRTIVGVNYTEDDKGQHYDLSNASEDTKKMLWSMLQTNEGQQQASFLGSTETEVTMQLTDQLILDGAGDGSGFGLAASIISDGTMSSKNPKVYDKATLLVSTFSKKTEDINQQDIDNAYIITDDYYGNNNGSIKSITPSSKLPKDIQAWLTTLDGLQTGSMYGEINANATHEANHLRAENIGLSPKRKETDAKHGSFPVEERTRRQWLQKFGPNSSVAPPQNINNLSDN